MTLLPRNPWLPLPLPEPFDERFGESWLPTARECLDFALQVYEQEKAVKAYVHFTNDGLPWVDRTTVYVSKEAEPRFVVPLLGRPATGCSKGRSPTPA